MGGMFLMGQSAAVCANVRCTPILVVDKLEKIFNVVVIWFKSAYITRATGYFQDAGDLPNSTWISINIPMC